MRPGIWNFFAAPSISARGDSMPMATISTDAASSCLSHSSVFRQ